jgi:hypothetical protein
MLDAGLCAQLRDREGRQVGSFEALGEGNVRL